MRTRFAIEIPHGLSLLAFHDPNAEVKGLDAVPRELWPPVMPVHFGFQIMVGLGTTDGAGQRVGGLRVHDQKTLIVRRPPAAAARWRSSRPSASSRPRPDGR